ncbi:MAG: tetratricopeptide repeat protein [Cyanobacteria bacterium P01_E01_bin.45]
MSRQTTIPKLWNRSAHELWLSGEQHNAIQTAVAALNQHALPKPRDLILQLAYYLFSVGDFRAFATILEVGLKSHPDDVEILQNLAVAWGRLNNYDKTIQYARQAIDRNPDNYLAWDCLASAYHNIRQYREAAEAGTNSLIQKDKQYGSVDSNWALPDGSPQAYAEGKVRAIAFSLWGNNRRYLYGALRNILLAPDIYPGWELWFYVDSSVPLAFRNLLAELGGKVLLQPDGQSLRQKLCWRFKVADADTVGYFLVRDIDSVINVREYLAVQEWLESGRWFHIIRDWWTHTDLILAGLWGGVAGVLSNVDQMLAGYVSKEVETPNIDQWFLRDRVWKYIKVSCLIHDRCFKQAGSRPLPGPCPGSAFHIGCCEYSVRPDFQHAMVAPWIEKADLASELS